jgi:hypothetical protein
VADSGTVDVEVQPNGHAAGNYDVHFGADVLTGHFDAAACDVPAVTPDATCL